MWTGSLLKLLRQKRKGEAKVAEAHKVGTILAQGAQWDIRGFLPRHFFLWIALFVTIAIVLIVRARRRQ